MEAVDGEVAAVDASVVMVGFGTVLEFVLGEAVVSAVQDLMVVLDVAPGPGPEAVKAVQVGKKWTRRSAFPARC